MGDLPVGRTERHQRQHLLLALGRAWSTGGDVLEFVEAADLAGVDPFECGDERFAGFALQDHRIDGLYLATSSRNAGGASHVYSTTLPIDRSRAIALTRASE